MSKEYNILEIVNGCLEKKAIYQRALVDRYAGFLYVICKRYLNDDGYAQDMVQDTFVKIFRNLDKFDVGKGSLESWISTIAIRTCLSKLSKKRLSVMSLEENPVDNFEDDNCKFILDQMATDQLISLVKELPDMYRQVFNLAAIDGYSHREIGQFMNISEAGSRSRLKRAKRILRNKINNLNKQELWVNSI